MVSNPRLYALLPIRTMRNQHHPAYAEWRSSLPAHTVSRLWPAAAHSRPV